LAIHQVGGELQAAGVEGRRGDVIGVGGDAAVAGNRQTADGISAAGVVRELVDEIEIVIAFAIDLGIESAGEDGGVGDIFAGEGKCAGVVDEGSAKSAGTGSGEISAGVDDQCIGSDIEREEKQNSIAIPSRAIVARDRSPKRAS
jgi:hypothetical protein